MAKELKTQSLNGAQGTLTRRQGKRWGVIFDDEECGCKALQPKNIQTEEHDSSHNVLAYLLYSADQMTEKSPEIQQRIDEALRYVEDGGIAACQCASCSKDVDFADMYESTEDPKVRVRKLSTYLMKGKCDSCCG